MDPNYLIPQYLVFLFKIPSDQPYRTQGGGPLVSKHLPLKSKFNKNFNFFLFLNHKMKFTHRINFNV